MALLCYNKGCGKNFDPEVGRREDECCFHPGEPKFHDAYKIWTCCQQKSTDFTQFLGFKGCTLGKHNPEKPIKIEPKREEVEDPLESEPIKKQPMKKPPDDSKFVPLKVNIKVNPNQKQENTTMNQEPKCLNNGCGVSPPNQSPCQYHPGFPVFHEGSKYWSCCQRKTTDFDAFLNQQGCETGDHKWGTPTTEKKPVNWRVDWFQTGNDVIINVFAKNVEHVDADCNGVIAKVNIDNEWTRDWKLFGIVNPQTSFVSVTASKVEIVLKKAEQNQWARLEC